MWQKGNLEMYTKKGLFTKVCYAVRQMSHDLQGPWEQGEQTCVSHTAGSKWSDTWWGCHFRFSISVRKLLAIVRRAEGPRRKLYDFINGGKPCARRKHSEESKEKREVNQMQNPISHFMDMQCTKTSYGSISLITWPIYLAGGGNVLLDTFGLQQVANLQRKMLSQRLELSSWRLWDSSQKGAGMS